MSRNIIWDGSTAADSLDVGVVPAGVQVIRNSYDARGKMEMILGFDDTGAGSELGVEVHMWDGTKYSKTGQQFILRDGEENFVALDGGQFFAFVVDAGFAFGAWTLNVGYVMFNN